MRNGAETWRPPAAANVVPASNSVNGRFSSRQPDYYSNSRVFCTTHQLGITVLAWSLIWPSREEHIMTRALVFIGASILLCARGYADAPATQPAAAAFDKMKSLAGEWKGKDSHGKETTDTYDLIAGNSAIMEKMHMGMVTMYTLDNDRVLMTHYRVAENQPRMIAKTLTDDGKTLHFEFLDASGMKDANIGHMHDLKLTFIDEDHIKQQWTFQKDGKDQFNEAIELT